MGTSISLLIIILIIILFFYSYKKARPEQELFGFAKLINIVPVIPFLVIFALVAYIIDSYFNSTQFFTKAINFKEFGFFNIIWLYFWGAVMLFAIPLCFNLFFYPRTDANKREKYIWLTSLFVFCLIFFNLAKYMYNCAYYLEPFSEYETPYKESIQKIEEGVKNRVKNMVVDIPNGLEYLSCLEKNRTYYQELYSVCKKQYPEIAKIKFLPKSLSLKSQRNKEGLYRWYKQTLEYHKLPYLKKLGCDVTDLYGKYDKKFIPIHFFVIFHIIAISIIMYVFSRILYYLILLLINIKKMRA